MKAANTPACQRKGLKGVLRGQCRRPLAHGVSPSRGGMPRGHDRGCVNTRPHAARLTASRCLSSSAVPRCGFMAGSRVVEACQRPRGRGGPSMAAAAARSAGDAGTTTAFMACRLPHRRLVVGIVFTCMLPLIERPCCGPLSTGVCAQAHQALRPGGRVDSSPWFAPGHSCAARVHRLGGRRASIDQPTSGWSTAHDLPIPVQGRRRRGHARPRR